MALKDHFHPPLSAYRHWHAFHSGWATYLASYLNERLPETYFAEPNVQFGIEIDVGTFEEAYATVGHPTAAASGGLRLVDSCETWASPAPTQTIPFTPLTDLTEVLVFDREAGPTLAGAIELVSPANKDRPVHRDAFVSKCAAYLQQGIGLIIVDIVTSRSASLHEDLLRRLGSSNHVPLDADLYAAAYRPVEHEDQDSLDIWQYALAVGGALPVLPLWLKGSLCVPVDLAATYSRTCREQRIPVNGSP